MRPLCGLEHLRDAEIREKEPVPFPDEDVRRLHVAVEDPLLVRGVERPGQLGDPRRRVGERDRAAGHPVPERPPSSQGITRNGSPASSPKS